MLTEPQPGRLIGRVCDSLQATALDGTAGDAGRAADLSAPSARRQLKAALWTLRELGQRLDAQAGAIARDIADMQAVLDAHADVLPCVSRRDGATDAERHRELQACVETLEAQAWHDGTPASSRRGAIVAELRALHLRMLERERDVAGPRAGDD